MIGLCMRLPHRPFDQAAVEGKIPVFAAIRNEADAHMVSPFFAAAPICNL